MSSCQDIGPVLSGHANCSRILTFFLASFICSVICIGMTLAVGAGIAYGYNYSLAEFVDLSRADVTVYIRRGQFADRPEVRPDSRRSSDDTKDLFSSNVVDYDDPKVHIDETNPLSDAWAKAQDTRNYADKLTKYSNTKAANMRIFPRAEEDDTAATTISDPIEPDDGSFVSISPNRTSLRKYDRDDPPLSIYTSPNSDSNDFDPRIEKKRHKYRKHKNKGLKEPDIKIEVDDANTWKHKHKDLRQPDIKIDVGEDDKRKHKPKDLRQPDVKIEVGEDDKSLYVIPHNKNATNYASQAYSDDIEYNNIYKPV